MKTVICLKLCKFLKKKKQKKTHQEKPKITYSFSNIKLYRKQPSAPSSDLLGLTIDSPSSVSAVVQSDLAVSPSGPSKW